MDHSGNPLFYYTLRFQYIKINQVESIIKTFLVYYQLLLLSILIDNC